MSSTPASVRYRFGRFELQPEERRLLADGVSVRVGPHAFDLLAALVARSGHLVTKDELLARVWHQVVVEENTLQVHVAALRKVLGTDAIATVSGRGYRFVPEVACVGAASTSDVPTRKHNLPHELTSFIGREKEIAQINDLMASTRLLTLTGAGGCGKTRLAMKVAGVMLDGYGDGVWFVEFAPLSDPTLIAQTVANALAVKGQAGKDLAETVAEALESKHLLLVLDNAEHLLGGCAQLADALLRRCGQLAILVTSREPLGISGELTYRVPSLSLPNAHQDPTSVEALACEAARLFIERARLQRPDFDITTKNAAALVSICRRLDGIALAIELAAPRVRSMSVEELSRHLDNRFGVLTGGSRTALPRHRTLRSLIDWSYDLLSDSEKTMLRRASVFAGGWTDEAAARVCGGGNLGPGEVLDLLTSLTDKNLVVAETRDDVTRFGMLETVRHYAQDRLRESGEQEPVRAGHLKYFVGTAEQLDEMQSDSERLVKLNRLDRELDNVRAALAWCEAAVTRSVTGLRLAGKLDWFWRIRGHVGEGRAWIARLLAVAPTSDGTEDHAVAFHVAGTLAYNQADYPAAEAHHREALAIFGQLGQRHRIARSLGSLGNVALSRDDLAGARALYEQALAMTREVGDRRVTAIGLHCLGMVTSNMGDLAAAQAFLEEGVSIGREIGGWSAAGVLAELGRVRHAQGDRSGARTLLMEALEREREFGNRQGIAQTLSSLGALSHDTGDIATAKAQLREALTIAQAVGARQIMPDTLEEFAGLSLEFASSTEGARLWGSAERLREESGISPSLFERQRFERQLAAARSALHDVAAFDLAWNEGRSWTLDEALRYALSI